MEKKVCWQSLLDFLDSHSLTNIVVAGDLNIIFEPKEKSGGNQDKDPFLELVDSLVLSCDLLDIKPNKGRFTRMNNRIGMACISARLDCFLAQSKFFDEFVLTSTIFSKVMSDHHPIGLRFEKEVNLGPIPFRFYPTWVKREGFGEIISHVWSHYIVGSPSYVWKQKLKSTKFSLKSWIKAPLENPMSLRVDTVQALANIQFSMENTEISKFHLTVEQSAQSSPFTAFRQEEEHLRLKSRSL